MIGHPVCSSLKFVSEVSHLSLLSFCVLNLFLLGKQLVNNYLSLFHDFEIFR